MRRNLPWNFTLAAFCETKGAINLSLISGGILRKAAKACGARGEEERRFASWVGEGERKPETKPSAKGGFNNEEHTL